MMLKNSPRIHKRAVPRQTSIHKSVICRPATFSSKISRTSIISQADDGKNWWEKIGKGAGGENKEDAARRAIQDSFSAKKYGGQQNVNPTPAPPAGGGGGFFGQGGGGSGGSGGFGGASDGDGAPEQPIWQEFLQLIYGVWVVVVNTGIFLAFANMLHRSLDWCCQIELLLLVGAPEQAFQRVATIFYSAIESFEKNVLGWDIPGDDEHIPMYENLALYYPEEHAYTFDAYRYNMSEDEKKKYKYYYALRHYERDGGVRGEVDAADIQAIEDKYEPMEADLRAYRAAKASGTLSQYWEDKKELYKSIVKGTTGGLIA